MSSNEQQLVDICFSVGLMINDPMYRRLFEKMNNEELAAWIANQLSGCGFNTFPCGASWGSIR